jgi:hypothetical protein
MAVVDRTSRRGQRRVATLWRHGAAGGRCSSAWAVRQPVRFGPMCAPYERHSGDGATTWRRAALPGVADRLQSSLPEFRNSGPAVGHWPMSQPGGVTRPNGSRAKRSPSSRGASSAGWIRASSSARPGCSKVTRSSTGTRSSRGRGGNTAAPGCAAARRARDMNAFPARSRQLVNLPAVSRPSHAGASAAGPGHLSWKLRANLINFTRVSLHNGSSRPSRPVSPVPLVCENSAQGYAASR